MKQKTLQLCLKDYISGRYHFLAEVTSKLSSGKLKNFIISTSMIYYQKHSQCEKISVPKNFV